MYRCLLCETPFEKQEFEVGDEGECSNCGLKFIITEGRMRMIITILSSENGDWYGMYVDDQLVLESDELTANEVIEALDDYFKFDVFVNEVEKSQEWFEENDGHCPEILEDFWEL